MANYIITNRKSYFENIGEYNYCFLEDMILPYTIAVDSETESLKFYKGEMFAIQIGTGTNNYLIDLETINIQKVIPFLKDKILVMHNALFDLTWLYKYNFFPWKVRDTFLARKILYNGLVQKRHDFGTVMEEELGIIYDKSEQKNIAKTKLSTDRAIQYCFNDVDKLLELKDKLHKQIIEKDFVLTYNLHCKWIRACAYMQVCGVPINEQKWQKKCDDDKKELLEKELMIKEYISVHLPEYNNKQMSLFDTGIDLNLSITSPLQMIAVFEKLGINVETKEGKSIAEDVIKKTKHEFVEKWLEYQSIKHDVTTFGENFKKNIWQGRLYTNYKPILDTARISAGGKNKDKTEVNDVNTLNIPANKKSRQPFEAKEGYKCIVADFEGQENSVGADQHKDPVMLASVLNGDDLHCAFARVLYPELKNLSDKEIKANHADKRDASKSPRFLFSYGGNAYTLNVNEGIPLNEANEIEKSYKELHSGIYVWGNQQLELALKKGYIESWGGFKLHLSYFEEFKKNHKWVKSLDREWWNIYKLGKIESKKEKEAIEEKKIYIIKNKDAYNLYRKHAYNISMYFKKKSEYFKLSLNSPIQSSSAHQTKGVTNALFEYIYKKNHFNKVRIAIILHDEFFLEVEESLCEEYRILLEKLMKDVGNKFISLKDISMKGEAFIANNWYSAKKGEN